MFRETLTKALQTKSAFARRSPDIGRNGRSLKRMVLAAPQTPKQVASGGNFVTAPQIPQQQPTLLRTPTRLRRRRLRRSASGAGTNLRTNWF